MNNGDLAGDAGAMVLPINPELFLNPVSYPFASTSAGGRPGTASPSTSLDSCFGSALTLMRGPRSPLLLI